MKKFPPLPPKGGGLFAFLILATIGCAAPSPAPSTAALEDLLRQGRDAETRGDGVAAGQAYDQAVREFPESSAAWTALGEHRRFWARDLRAAEEAFRKAITVSQATPESLAFATRGLGEIARAEGKTQQAIVYFDASLAVLPSVEAHRSLSALYATELRDFHSAAEHAKAAVELSPDDPIALLQYAVQMVRFKKPREAEEAFQKAVGLAGCDVNGRSNGHVHCCVLYNGACYHAVRGDKAGALAMLKEFFMTPNHRHITKDEILKDPDFESLLKDGDFQALLEYRLPLD